MKLKTTADETNPRIALISESTCPLIKLTAYSTRKCYSLEVVDFSYSRNLHTKKRLCEHLRALGVSTGI